MADISTIKTGEREIDIKHPSTGESIGLRIGVVHLDDEKLAAVKRRIRDNNIDMQRRGKAVKGDELDANERAITFAATTGWKWYNPTGGAGDRDYDAEAGATFHGEVPDYNVKNFNEVVKELPWIKTQIVEEVGDIKNFFD